MSQLPGSVTATDIVMRLEYAAVCGDVCGGMRRVCGGYGPCMRRYAAVLCAVRGVMRGMRWYAGVQPYAGLRGGIRQYVRGGAQRHADVCGGMRRYAAWCAVVFGRAWRCYAGEGKGLG